MVGVYLELSDLKTLHVTLKQVAISLSLCSNKAT